MRRTKSPRQAVERALAAFPQVPQREKKLKRRNKDLAKLAFMFDGLRRMKVPATEVQAKVRWYGTVPFDGIKGWEAEALEWGRIDYHEEGL